MSRPDGLGWDFLSKGSYDYWLCRLGARRERPEGSEGTTEAWEAWEERWQRLVREAVTTREGSVWVRGHDKEWVVVESPGSPVGWEWTTRPLSKKGG